MRYVINKMNFEDKYKDVVYIVIDVESNGSSVKKNSMFALGCVAIEVVTKNILGGFAYNVSEIPGTEIEPRCWNEFWSKEKLIYDELHKNQVDEKEAVAQIIQFVQHIKDMGKQIMFASDCAVYDWKWVDTAILNHSANNPLGYTAMDIYSYAAGMFKEPRHSVWKTIENLKGTILHVDDIKHDHNPFNDALSEACLLVDLIRLNESQPVMKLQNNLDKKPYNEFIINKLV